MSDKTMTPWMTARVGARLLLLQARWDPARMQGAGFAFALDPWLVECWASEPAALLDARRRHLEYFNTHPVAAWLAAGIVCRQEAAAAALSGAARTDAIERIRSLKESLGASLAGLYDSFFWGALRPASAVAAVLAVAVTGRMGSRHSLVFATATALTVYNVPAMTARIVGLNRGFAEGERAVIALTTFPAQAWISGLRLATIAGAWLTFALFVEPLASEPLARAMLTDAALTFAAGLILSWRGVPPLTQLGIAGLGGMAASAAGLWP